ncbi:MetQ/NlpA family ABC transporter substrate-binding protein [Priestia taiwanensis]|uniref:Lipoprotein n=1 Tax=Priestia taiwanensis TaxID=1347902 RepID=A0A917AYE0_9BACI|nr:MetQ/NlpA family ABC transporter substrate-binding protein [Priestia taiwanensis]MBM7364534.1 D-methionine transport system substrate-binding protein [Priestia taiwanensis]GGE80781.1 lipoprotein [Priestia taiwanensis]
MKKIIFIVLTAILALSLAACGQKKEDAATKETKTIKIGASSVPHAAILEKAKPALKEKGIELEITEFQDYVLPNKALADKEIDANFFQHIPYLNKQMAEHGYKFENAGGVHIEPIGVYSKKYKTLEELPEGATILMSSSVADHGRMLSLLEKAGLIKLEAGVDKTKAEQKHIVENKKNLKFATDYEASFLPKAFENNEGDAVLINSNFAIDNGITPTKDAIALEESNSPYVNIIAVREGDKEKAEIKTLLEVLRSKEIQDFINEEYKGSVVPVKN